MSRDAVIAAPDVDPLHLGRRAHGDARREESFTPHTSWSPYYKVEVLPIGDGANLVDVNGIPHQTIESTARRRRTESRYFAPYERAPPTHCIASLSSARGPGT